MLRTIGRIILIATGALLVGFGIYFMVSLFQGGFKITDGKNWSEFGLDLVAIITGLSALFSGIKNRCGFWFVIFSLVTLGILAWFVTKQVQAGDFTDWNSLGQFCIKFALNIAYVVGFILMIVGRKRKKSKASE